MNLASVLHLPPALSRLEGQYLTPELAQAGLVGRVQQVLAVHAEQRGRGEGGCRDRAAAAAVVPSVLVSDLQRKVNSGLP